MTFVPKCLKHPAVAWKEQRKSIKLGFLSLISAATFFMVYALWHGLACFATRIKELSGNVFPNIIASLISVGMVSLIVPRLFAEEEREKYIRIVKPVREFLRQKRIAGKVTEKDAQELMTEIADVTFRMHFGDADSFFSGKGDGKVHCNTCDLPCMMKDGACSKCKEPKELWLLTNPE